MKEILSFKNFSLDLFIKLVNFLLQALFYFFIIKIIPIDVYGAIASITAIVATFYVLSDVSFSELIIKYGSRKILYAEYFLLLSLNLHFYLGIFLLFFLSIVIPFLLFKGDYRFSIPVFFLITTDLILFKIIYIYSRYLLALGEIVRSNIVNTVWLLFKFFALVIFYYLKQLLSLSGFYMLLLLWSFIYFFAEFLALIFYFKKNAWLVELLKLKKTLGVLRRYKGESLHFCIGIFSKSMYTNIDKIMLTKLSDFGSVGIYSFLLKVFGIFSFPTRSLMYIIYPRLFKLSVNNVSLLKLLHLVMLVILMNIFSTLPFLLISKYIWTFLNIGRFNFLIVISMFVLVNIQVLANIISDILTGLNFQNYRSKLQFLTLILNVLLNAILIPKYSILGAIFATIFSEFLLFVSAIYILRKKVWA